MTQTTNRKALILVLLSLCLLVLLTSLNGSTTAATANDLVKPDDRPTYLIVGEPVSADLKITYDNADSWAHRIHVPEAQHIKVRFAYVDLLEGDTITVSDPDGKLIHTYPGSTFTTDENPGFYALSIIGDTAIVQLHTTASPSDDIDAAGVHINSFTRGYPQWEIEANNPQEYRSTCGALDRVDASCYAASHPTDYANSEAVARLTFMNGAAHCTGWRVSAGNYVMTNEHCITSQAEADTLELWFDYERETCGGTLNTPVIADVGDFLIDDPTLDFALVTVNDADFPAVQPFGFLELDPRMTVLGEEIYIPQHGAGNPREFGIESDVNQPSGLCEVDHPTADGFANDTDVGYRCDTIGGSSGSPVLARSTHKVVALHHFGNGAAPNCAVTDDGTSLNRGVRIELIWPLIQGFFEADFSVSANPPTVDVCEGTMANTTIDVGSIGGHTDDVTLSSTFGGSFSVNPVSPPGTSDYSLDTTGMGAGAHVDTITGTSTTPDKTADFTINVFAGAPGAVTLTAPADGSTGVSTSPVLMWTADPNAATYNVEVATDAAFNDIVASATGIVGTSWTASGLQPSTTYYWRVAGENPCSSGDWSSAWSFTTGAIICNQPALAIPDNDPNGISDDIVVSSAIQATLDDIDVSLDISHTWVGDLAISIEHVETGTTATLFDRPGVPGSTFGCADNNIDGTADDEGNIADIENHCPGSDPWLSDSFVPTTALSVFDGEDLAGTWRLTVSDNAGGDTGTINEWCLLPTEMPTAVEMSDLGSNGSSNVVVLAAIGFVTTLTAAGLLWVNRRNDQIA